MISDTEVEGVDVLVISGLELTHTSLLYIYRTRGNQGKPGETRENQGKPGKTRGNQGKPGETRGNQGKPGEIRETWKI